MSIVDEVVPDSQDEAELDDSDIPFCPGFSPPFQRHPLVNATIPSLRSSTSYVPSPAKQTAISTISEYTTGAVHTNDKNGLSTISAFTSSSSFSSNISVKPRPKPRPNFVQNDTPASENQSTDSPIKSPVAALETYALSPPRDIFVVDMSERVKARRAHLSQTQRTTETTSERATVKRKRVSTVIDINLDDIPNEHPPKPRPKGQTDKRESSSSLRINSPGPTPVMDFPDVDEPTSPATSRKRKHEPMTMANNKASSSDDIISAGNVNTDTISDHVNEQDVMLPPKKKKSKNMDSTEKPKKTRTKKDEQLKKPRGGKEKEKEKEQFKSSEFIFDSDEEPRHSDGGATTSASTKLLVEADSAPAPVSLKVPAGSNSERAKKNGQELKKSRRDQEKERGQFKSSEFVLDGDDELTVGSGDGAVPSSVQSSGDGSISISTLPKPAQVAFAPTALASSNVGEMPSTKKKASSNKRKAKIDAQKRAEVQPSPPKKPRRGEEVAREKPGNSAAVGPDGTAQAIETPAIPKAVSSTKKKGGRQKIVEDEDDEAEAAKENAIPIPKLAQTTTSARAPQKSPPSSKPSYTHPPKNRPLSAILQLVNGASPRARASLSMSRKLLTRIAPLHPNRRTPPPPPPPRIVPKKTKKELEREERWEEELQESVPGWCGLEEGERERMRREKRNWELGLCED